MKKIILPTLILGFFMSARAQDVSIYTTNGTLTGDRTLTLGNYNLTFKPNSPTLTNSLFLATNGNVGVNTALPTEKFDVNGNLKATRGLFTAAPANGQFFATNEDRINASTVLAAGSQLDPATINRVFNVSDMPQSNMDASPTVWLTVDNRNYWTRLRYRAVQDGDSQFTLFDKVQTETFTIDDDGNNNVSLVMPKANSRVMIGTSSFTDGTDVYSLSVNGNVRADRVKVYTTWADYVFEDDYKLPTLEEVEKHIKEKGHLKDIPSAKEVEENGIELGEMNKLLLQKIEELTLYMIDQKKENEKQGELIKQLEEKVKTLSGVK